jgi:hypothetical protein
MSSRIEERQQDEETMDNLDFEEISDEELDPEESRTGKPSIKSLTLCKKSLSFLFLFSFLCFLNSLSTELCNNTWHWWWCLPLRCFLMSWLVIWSAGS